MVSLKSIVALLPVIIAGVEAQGKQVVNPELRREQIWTKLLEKMPPTQSSRDQWGAGWIPEECSNFAKMKGENPNDYDVWNVHYTDCGDAWVMCRHRNSRTDLNKMIDYFGRLPVHVRSYVRHFVVTGGLSGGLWFDGGNIALGDNSVDMYVLTHEAGHTLDHNALRQWGNPFSSTQIWHDANGRDARIPTAYSATNWVENFAESVPLAFFDRLVPGGLGTIQPNWPQVFNQYSTANQYLGDLLNRGGSCSNRMANSRPIPKTARKIKARLEDLGEMPDVSLSSNVTVIDVTTVTHIHDDMHHHAHLE